MTHLGVRKVDVLGHAHDRRLDAISTEDDVTAKFPRLDHLHVPTGGLLNILPGNPSFEDGHTVRIRHPLMLGSPTLHESLEFIVVHRLGRFQHPPGLGIVGEEVTIVPCRELIPLQVKEDGL